MRVQVSELKSGWHALTLARKNSKQLNLNVIKICKKNIECEYHVCTAYRKEAADGREGKSGLREGYLLLINGNENYKKVNINEGGNV